MPDRPAPDPVIRSRHNPVYKAFRSLLRRERRHQERAFLVEGPRFIADAERLGYAPQVLAISESRFSSAHAHDSHHPATRILSDELFDSISDTATSQGMIGLFSFPDVPAPQATAPLILLADGIQDPGNLGTLIRSAAAAGATGVIAMPGTADPWSPKTVRAAAAAHFAIAVTICSFDSLPTAIPSGAAIIGADAAGSQPYDRVDLTKPVVLAIGAEGHGLSNEIRAMMTQLVTIPLHNNIESLNAGVAGSVLLFEASRQRIQAANAAKIINE